MLKAPLLIHWPRHINPGSINDNLIKIAGFLPTLREIADEPMSNKSIDEQSFAESLSGLV